MILSTIRTKFGTVIISIIIGGIAFVFVFYGVMNPRSTRGMHEGAVAGTVNGDAITLAEFNRELKRRTDFFRGLMGGGQINDEQLKAFRVKGMVFEELVRRKLLLQEAERQGLLASDEEMKEQINGMAAFQKDGKFDFNTYKQVLEANNYSAGSFERMMREDLSVQRWNDYFKDRVQVSEAEARKRFLITEDKRDIRYVLLNAEVGKKGVKVGDSEVQKFLGDNSKKAIAQGQFDREKDAKFKGKTFDQVKDSIVREILAGDRMEEIRKINEGLAEKVLPMLTADKSSDAKVNALLKPYETSVRATGLISRLNPYLPGIGEAKELMADLFSSKSPIDPKQGGKAKKYSSGAWVLVAVISETQRPDLSKFEASKAQMYRTVVTQKQRELFEEWVKKLKAKATVDPNPAVVSDEPEGEEG